MEAFIEIITIVMAFVAIIIVAINRIFNKVITNSNLTVIISKAIDA